MNLETVLAVLLLSLQIARANTNVVNTGGVRSVVPQPREAGSKLSPENASKEDTKTEDTVSVLLGNEGEDDLVKHIAKQKDGRTTIEVLDGVRCRYMNRKAEGKYFGYLYFSIHPDFKQDGLEEARIDVDYFITQPTICRLQYDAMDGEKHKRYKSVLATKANMSGAGGTVSFSQLYPSNTWQTVTFHVTNAAFLNSQNGGADFRLEVAPAEIYVRRVSVTRLGGTSTLSEPKKERKPRETND